MEEDGGGNGVDSLLDMANHMESQFDEAYLLRQEIAKMQT